MRTYKAQPKKDANSWSKGKKVKFCVTILVMLAAAVVVVVTGVFSPPTENDQQPPPVSPEIDVQLDSTVSLKTEGEGTSYLLYKRTRENHPVEIRDEEEMLLLWNFHENTELNLTFSFRDSSGKDIEDVFNWKPKKIKLLPKSAPGSGPMGGPPKSLVVLTKLAQVKEIGAQRIELWVFGAGDTAKVPVVLGERFFTEHPSPAKPTQTYKNLQLWVGDEYTALSDVSELRIETNQNYLFFKNQARGKLEARFRLERGNNPLTEGFDLKPESLVLLRRGAEDSLSLVFLSDTLFQTSARNVELVISTPEDEELFRIPLVFEPKLTETWADYVKFHYAGEEIREATVLPAHPGKWQQMKLVNDNPVGISVTYQVAMDSQGVMLLDGGQMVVKKNSEERVDWERKPLDLDAVTFRFKVTSEKGQFDTTFLMSVSSGSLFVDMKSFFVGNWLVILLCLAVAGLGYLSYDRIARSQVLKRERDKRDELLKKREIEIGQLKFDLKSIQAETSDFGEQAQQRAQRQFVSEQKPAGDELLFLKQQCEKKQETLNNLSSVLNKKESDLSQKTQELEETETQLRQRDTEIQRLKHDYSESLTKQTELNNRKAELESTLEAREKTITQNNQEIDKLRKNGDDLEKRVEHLEKNISHLRVYEYPERMHELLQRLVAYRLGLKDESKTSSDAGKMFQIYREFEEVESQIGRASLRPAAKSPSATTYDPARVIAEVLNVGVFINNQLSGIFSSEEEFQFFKIDPGKEKAKDLKVEYDQEAREHLEKIVSKIRALDAMIDSGKNLQSNLENIKKHVLEEVANQVFITCAELESAGSGVAQEVKGVFRRMKEYFSLLIARFYELQPMEIRLGQDYDSEHFQIVGQVEGEADSRYSRYGRNSIVSITSWGYYKAKTKKVEVPAKVQVKK